MFNKRLKTLINKNTHVFLSVVFTVFIFSQFASLQHQVQHLNEYNDTSCVECISLPDQLGDSSTVLFIAPRQESTAYKTTYQSKPAKLTLRAYSARAPPSLILIVV